MGKVCKTCDVIKPIAEFYKNKELRDGHFNECKMCCNKRTRENVANNAQHYRDYHREISRLPHYVKVSRDYKQTQAGKQSIIKACLNWNKKHPDRRSAITALNHAIATGKVKRYPCWVCGSIKTHGHHPAYDQPMNVIWLCPMHHKEVHNLVGRIDVNRRNDQA